jgi:hypothetical protein
MAKEAVVPDHPRGPSARGDRLHYADPLSMHEMLHDLG